MSNSGKEIAGMSIKIGILGYGNLARGVESAIMQNDDLELAAVFTRRDPASVSIRTAGVPVLSQCPGDLRRQRDGSSRPDSQICRDVQRSGQF